MPYLGVAPNPRQNREVDDISSGFNGGTTQFTLQVGGSNVSPGTDTAIIVSLGGVIQNPGTDYTIAASTITFTTAPASGLSFFGVVLAQSVDIETPADGTVTTSKIVNDAVTADKLAHTSVTAGSYTTADITVDAQGRITAAASGTISGAEIADQAVTNAKVNNSAAIAVSKLANFVTNNADNRIITGSGTTNTLNAESEFTFDGSNIFCRAGEGGNASLNLIADQGDDNGDGWKIQSEQDENDLTFKSNISGSYVDKLKLKSSGQLEVQGNLAVSGTITPTGNVVIPDTIVHDGDSNTKIRFPAADTVTVETAGSERARIDSQGRFLINTSSYKSNLNASADSSGQVAQFVHAGDNINGCLSVFAYSGSTQPTTRGAKLQLHRARSSDGSTNTILSNGDLIGSIEFKGNDGANFTAAARIDVMVDGGTGTDDMPGRLQFFTSGDGSGAPTERMRIDNTGRVMINTTSNALGGVTGNLNIANENTNNHTVINCSRNTANDRNQIRFLNPNGNVGSITSSGTSTSFNTSSDYRLKENQVAISNGITRLKQLKPYRFNFKTDSSTILDGFFAHEVSSVVPEAITGTKDAVVTQAMIDAGDFVEGTLNDPIHQGIDQSKLVPLLVAAVQELITKVEALEAA